MEPIPNCPSELSPQQYKALKLSKVQVWEPPKEIVFEPEDTDNGELEFVDCFVPDDQLLAEGDALSKAGIYFRPGKIIQASNRF